MLSVPETVQRSIHGIQPVYAVKVYLYYEDAWWITKLGHREGTFVAPGNAVSPPLDGRYHDGDVRCNADFTICHGFLQTNYFWDFSGRTQNYFGRFQANQDEVVTYLNQTTDGYIAMQELHRKVCEYHNLSSTATPGPTEGILVNYNLATPFANSAWHYWTDANQERINRPLDTSDATLQSFLSDQKIHVVNEAYSPAQGWAEGAIYLGDELMQDVFGLDPPHAPVGYLPRNYESKVWADAPVSLGLPTTCTSECLRNGVVDSVSSIFANNGACNDGADGSTVAACDYGTDCGDCGPRPRRSGDGAPVAEDPACFTKDARLLLANGTRIALASATKGMVVTSALGEGIITEVLKHPIHALVERFRMPTVHGDLVGTLDHPVSSRAMFGPFHAFSQDVHVNGSWLEAWDAHSAGHLPGLEKEKAYIDFFYNLEIDGDRPGASAHAYDLNGHTVSGLGDNEVLNRKFPRQKQFLKSKL
ncbi:MAG: hypothetical protein SGPRY_007200 [Prymnesium sp.]